MDIQNISSQLKNNVNEARSSEHTGQTASIRSQKDHAGIQDKVAIERQHSGKNEELYARIELEKLNQRSLDKLKDLKSKIIEYQYIKEQSPEKAKATEIGQLLNSADVWEEIAQKMLK